MSQPITLDALQRDPAAPRTLLRQLFDVAVDTALPYDSLKQYLPQAPKGRTVVIGAGKGAASMAAALEAAWPGELSGMVITRYAHTEPTRAIRVVEASHPVPDAAGREAAEQVLASVQGLTEDDLVICLISGGGSALLSLPVPEIPLDDKRAVNKALLKSGAAIDEMNCVRKHLSAIKGGRLAAACYPAKVVTLAISDVPGDDPSVIASGPTVADPTTFDDARAVIAKYGIELPASVQAYLDNATAAQETPKPGDPRLARCETHIITTPQASLQAAAKFARAIGLNTIVLGDTIEGEARDVALVHAGIVRQVVGFDEPVQKPALILSGGETTVTVRGNGRGGRNAEFLLALAVALNGEKGVYAVACDTDGIDGSEDNAGCLLTPCSIARAAKAGVSAKQKLANNDAYSFFESIDDLIVTGPTRTNVNDFRAILVLPQ
ncbi:glycerate kinase [Neisseriaceae bacterium JH1-16]|nr:glycerate kinase [Neisseriaceae bacterium JH1-16]